MSSSDSPLEVPREGKVYVWLLLTSLNCFKVDFAAWWLNTGLIMYIFEVDS